MIKKIILYSDNEEYSKFKKLKIEYATQDGIEKIANQTCSGEFKFVTVPSGQDYGWHTAEKKQYVVMLQGEIEVEVANSQKETFSAGDVVLVDEKPLKKGHRTKVISKEDWICLMLAV